MELKNGTIIVKVCDRCIENNIKEPRLAKLKCPFCQKDVCQECTTSLDWHYTLKTCQKCMEFLNKTTGGDLKRLGFKAKYDSIKDSEAITEAVKEIENKFRELGKTAVSEMLKSLYEESQRREHVKVKREQKLKEIEEAKRKLDRLEKEQKEAQRDFYHSVGDALPF